MGNIIINIRLMTLKEIDDKTMDRNVVCSRRVHDGYATIRRTRTRRCRPQPLYRSDSNELLKVDDLVPRWTGSNGVIENYGTLRNNGIKKTLEPNYVPRGDLYRTTAEYANGFATLPRRVNHKDDRRFSGTLEPLYEHAVSDPVKPRFNRDNVIPWWELATRKYRHRSCPSLEVCCFCCCFSFK